MSRYLQFHMLTFYPPSNLNRDDNNMPKTAMVGTASRLRISSQCHKRTWRTSDRFEEVMDGHLGIRTAQFGTEINAHLLELGAEPARAHEIALAVASIFGTIGGDEEKTEDGAEAKKGGKRAPKEKKKDENGLTPIKAKQLAFISPAERQKALDVATMLYKDKTVITDKTIKHESILQRTDTAIDIAMFGRMMAGKSEWNRDAAIQVSHAVTTHKVMADDDYYTAIDELNKPEDNAGAQMVGDMQFGSGVFYTYICVNTELLIKNLDGDADLAQRGLDALIEAIAKVSPKGKQTSYASQSYAGYIMAEAGNQQPRSLLCAYIKPVTGADIMAESIARLEETCEDIDHAFGKTADARISMNVKARQGTLDDIKTFAKAHCDGTTPPHDGKTSGTDGKPSENGEKPSASKKKAA